MSPITSRIKGSELTQHSSANRGASRTCTIVNISDQYPLFCSIKGAHQSREPQRTIFNVVSAISGIAAQQYFLLIVTHALHLKARGKFTLTAQFTTTKQTWGSKSTRPTSIKPQGERSRGRVLNIRFHEPEKQGTSGLLVHGDVPRPHGEGKFGRSGQAYDQMWVCNWLPPNIFSSAIPPLSRQTDQIRSKPIHPHRQNSTHNHETHPDTPKISAQFRHCNRPRETQIGGEHDRHHYRRSWLRRYCCWPFKQSFGNVLEGGKTPPPDSVAPIGPAIAPGCLPCTLGVYIAVVGSPSVSAPSSTVSYPPWRVCSHKFIPIHMDQLKF